MRAFPLFVVVLCSALPALAAPSLQRIEPPGGKQGSEVEVRITGTELGDPQELFFEDGRVSVVKLETEKDDVVKATLRIPADCPPGPQRVRLRTVDGLSDLRVFHVHGSEQVAEKEPNDLADKAQPLELGQTAWGTIRGEDVDLFKIRLPAGGRVSAVIDGVRLEQQMFDPHLELLDAEGNVLASCDDTPLLSQDAAVAATVKTAGDYFLRLREAAYAGNGTYQLHVGKFPIPHAAWPPGGKAGSKVDVEWLGDPGGSFRQTIVLPEPALDGLARVQPSKDGAVGPAAVPLRVTTAPVTLLDESGNEPAQAGRVTAPAAVAGRMDGSDDVDWIRVEAPKDSRWRVSGWGRRLGSPVDLVVAAHRDNDKRDRITSNDDSDGPDSKFAITTPAEGSFLLRVSDFQHRGGPGFVYWIDVEPALPSVDVSVSPATTRTQQRLVATVPRGNRMALFFNSKREGCDAPARIDFGRLPAGVTALTSEFAEPASGGLVVFEASADAAPGTALAEVTVRRAGEQAERLGGLRQLTDLVFGEPNNTVYRSAFGDKLAIAVVEEAPVTIELLPPSTPLVRRGLVDLKVRVIRSADFDGRVRLELPFKPPGIAAGLVDVKPDQTEVAFPLTVAADAPVKQWQVAMAAALMPDATSQKKAAQSRRAGAGAWIASRPVTLSVIEPLVDLLPARAAAERGQETKLVFKMASPPSFTGTATATLVGLPLHVESVPVEVKPGAESIEFPLRIGSDSPLGKHATIMCQIDVPLDGGRVLHQSPPATLRIDKPLAGQVAAKP